MEYLIQKCNNILVLIFEYKLTKNPASFMDFRMQLFLV